MITSHGNDEGARCEERNSRSNPQRLSGQFVAGCGFCVASSLLTCLQMTCDKRSKRCDDAMDQRGNENGTLDERWKTGQPGADRVVECEGLYKCGPEQHRAAADNCGRYVRR